MATRRQRSGHAAATLAPVDGLGGGVSDDGADRVLALAAAVSAGARAAGRGFDWPDVSGPLSKVEEELSELRAALLEGPARAEEELGDALFALVNVARHLRLDPERALLGTVDRFERRLGVVESLLGAAGRSIAEASEDELAAAWAEAKARERDKA